MPVNFEERLTALEKRVDMESGLRASIDLDLSVLALGQRSNTSLLQALGLTQSDHTRLLDKHTKMLEELGTSVNQRFEEVNGRFAEMDGRFTEVDGRLDHMDGKLTEIIGMLKARES